MGKSTSRNKKLQPKKVVVLQNIVLNNGCEQPERNKRKLCSLLDDEEPVPANENDDKVKKKYLHKFRESYNLSNTKSEKSRCDNFTQNIETQFISSGCVHMGVQCESKIEQKDAEIQCNTVKQKDAGVQNDFLIEKKDAEIQSCLSIERKDTETQCDCQPLQQEFNLLWVMNQFIDTPIGKNKDLNQLIRLCKKLLKNPPAELRNKEAANYPFRMEKMDTSVNRLQTHPDSKATAKKRKTEDTFKKPAATNKGAIPSSSFSFSNSNRMITRERAACEEFRSLTLGERKKRKLYSPTTWECSKRYSENFVKDPAQHRLFK